MGGDIGSGLYAPDLRETSPISSPVYFAFILHKYAMSLAPPLLTLPALAFAALEPLPERRAPGRRRETGEAERERERGTHRRS